MDEADTRVNIELKVTMAGKEYKHDMKLAKSIFFLQGNSYALQFGSRCCADQIARNIERAGLEKLFNELNYRDLSEQNGEG